jgi:sugar/nucleoside kinase (ribokinase family)
MPPEAFQMYERDNHRRGFSSSLVFSLKLSCDDFFMRKFKITVVGSINRDTIIFPNGKSTESFGGILYNLSALSGLAGSSTEIFPVCNLGYDVFDRVTDILKEYHNVKLDGVKRVRRKNNHACLLIDRQNQREEILRHRVPVLGFGQIRPFLDSDSILINFISGYDVQLDSLRKIREKARGIIFMDVHSLTLGISEDGKRYYRTPPYWREYVRQADLVQINHLEANILAGRDLASQKDMKDFAKSILDIGPKALLVTLAEDGALMFMKKRGACKMKREAGIKVRAFKDATGCGDVFSAAFLFHYLHHNDLTKALNFANRVAAFKCRVSGVEEISGLLERSFPRLS